MASSSAFRVTQRSIHERSIVTLSQGLERLATLQERLGSGKLINRPSDSPTGTVVAMQYRADIRRFEQYTRNAIDGENWLAIADTTLQGVLGVITRVKELSLRGINASLGTPEREAIAAEIEALREDLIDLSNTRYTDRPLFNGTSDSAAAYDDAGTYIGDGAPPVNPEVGPVGKIERVVSPGVTVRVNLTGPEIFGDQAATDDLFETIDRLVTDFRTVPMSGADVAAHIKDLDNHSLNIQNQLSRIGARALQVESTRQRTEQALLVLRNGLSETEDIDLPKTIVDLQLQEVSYRVALDATARVIQPSLLEFLR
jgi:flagellar hook-associated protein 3 FlgL